MELEAVDSALDRMTLAMPELGARQRALVDELVAAVSDGDLDRVRPLLGSAEEKLFRIARNLRIPAGTVEIQRNAIARGLLRP